MAQAVAWVSRITSLGVEMVAPGLIGNWLDGRLGTSFLCLVGFGLGFLLGFLHLLAMTGVIGRRKGGGDDRRGADS